MTAICKKKQSFKLLDNFSEKTAFTPAINNVCT